MAIIAKPYVALIFAGTAPNGPTKYLLSFWGEPFMSQDTGRDIPRYLFHIQGHSELVSRFVKLVRSYRIGVSDYAPRDGIAKPQLTHF